MITNLPVAHLDSLGSVARTARRERHGISSVLRELVEGRIDVALVRERRLTIALAIRQIHPGVCLIAREGNGRGLYIGPPENAAIKLLESA
jgi:hypothetical protein